MVRDRKEFSLRSDCRLGGHRTNANRYEKFDVAGKNGARSLLVSTFDASGNNVPENVNVVVICP